MSDPRRTGVKDLGLGRLHFPEPAVVGAPGGSAHAARLLREGTEADLIRRGLDHDPRARQRPDEELAVIRTLQHDTYFLTVVQVVADVRELGIRLPLAARGPRLRHRQHGQPHARHRHGQSAEDFCGGQSDAATACHTDAIRVAACDVEGVRN